MEEVRITIAGAGVIGLAIAAVLSKQYSDIVVIEKNPSFGEEASSRNSEVIHAGIYYPKDSLKARLCLEGKKLLYDYCQENKIGFKKLGKLIVAVDSSQEDALQALFKHGLNNGVKDLILLSREQIKKLEPHINASLAIHSPSTGIFDTHGFMKRLALQAQSNGVDIAYNTTLEAVEKKGAGFKVSVRDAQEGWFYFFTHVFINACGLYSDRVARMAGIYDQNYTLRYCKGNYFRVHGNKAKFLNHLIYPVPSPNSISLGIHTAVDLAGSLKLGPDAEYVDKIDYSVDESKKDFFYQKAHPFLPFIELNDLSGDMTGIRAKLQGKNEPFRDFLISSEIDKGLTGFINLIGIDSPGLTCALSIARLVKDIVKPLL